MLLSFIVPVFNGEKTIKKCLDSICKIDSDDFEILVVDDGSTDNTQKELDDLINTERRMRVFKTYNQGVSKARNYGVEQAYGEYITFVDCDDWIEPSSFSKMIALLSANNSDLFVADYFSYGHKQKSVKRKILMNGENSSEKLFAELLMGISNHVWGNIYYNKLIRENNIKFREEINVGEDALFNLNYGRYCRKIYYFQQEVYYYNIINNDSVMHKHRFEHVNDYILLFDSFREILNTYPYLNIDIDENYYCSQLYRCLYSQWPRIDSESKKKIKQSFFYAIISKKRYNGLKIQIKRLLISFALFDFRIIHPLNKN